MISWSLFLLWLDCRYQNRLYSIRSSNNREDNSNIAMKPCDPIGYPSGITQVYHLMSALDEDLTGRLDYNRFLGQIFRPASQQSSSRLSNSRLSYCKSPTRLPSRLSALSLRQWTVDMKCLVRLLLFICIYTINFWWIKKQKGTNHR